MPVPPNTRTLVLNNDYTPLNIVRWKKGFKKSVSDSECEHCEGIGYIEHKICFDCGGCGTNPPCMVFIPYDNVETFLRGCDGKKWDVPSILVNKHHVKRTLSRVPYSKPNIIRRDDSRCQYCSIRLNIKDIELEHVVPKSMWQGEDPCTNWHNIVVSCHDCNAKKADKTPEQAGMSLRKTVEREDGTLVTIPYTKPKCPNYTELILGINPYHIEKLPKEWMPYINPLLGKKMVAALRS